MSIIKDKCLYPKDPSKVFDGSIYGNKSYIKVILEKVQAELETTGDREWLVNGSLRYNHKTTVYGGEKALLSDVIPMTKKIAKALVDSGVKKGDTVKIFLTNSADYYYPLFGAWWANAIVSASDPNVTPESIESQLDDTKAKVIFCCKSNMEIIKKVAEKKSCVDKIIVVDIENNIDGMASFKSFIDGIDYSDLPDPELVEPDDVAMIHWSSGTTGKPKGIQYSQGVKKAQLDPTPTPGFTFTNLVITTCMFHAGGSMVPISNGIMKSNGCRVIFLVTEDVETTDDMLNVIANAKPEYLSLGSHHCYELSVAENKNDYDLNSVMLMSGVGATLPVDIDADLKNIFPKLMAVINPYGSTEVGFVSLGMSMRNIGGVFKEVVVKIIDQNTGEALGPNQIGEIVTKNKYAMKSYLNRPEDNAKFFGSDGFMHTGDLGYYDENGVLYFQGRMKELIKYKNSHLYPVEIENIIYEHFPDDVYKVAVFGKPDPSVQELVTAAIVKKPDSKLSEEDVIKLVDSKVMDFKRLRGGVKFLNKMPTGDTGKIQRRNLVEMFK